MAAQFGRRLRRGAATTAVAAVVMAALTASQAPDPLSEGPGRSAGAPSDDHPIDGGSPYHTELPPLQTPDKPDTSIDLPGLGGDAESGIPATVLAAYKQAEAALGRDKPGCNLPWELLAAIGKVESGQARGGAVDAEGTTLKPILGPQLNGNGFANITDTDGGTYDNDTTHDRAVGPMQFIPSTWMTWGADGNGDGAKDPNNIYDAALAAGRYLCAGNRDLSVRADLEQAILGYNRSGEYLRTVLSWLDFYRKGTHEVPDGTGVLPVSPGAGSDPSAGTPGGQGPSGGGPGRTPDDADGGSGGGSGNSDGTDGTEGADEDGGSSEPTVTAGGSISPDPGPSESETTEPTTKPTKKPTDEPSGEPSGDPTGGPSDEPTECPTDTASPSPGDSESGSASPPESTSPAPSPSGSGSPSTSPSGEPTQDPCGDDEDEDGGAEAAEPEPAPSTSTGAAIGAALARMT